MLLHKAVVLVVAVGCSQSSPRPEVLAGPGAALPPPAMTLSSASLLAREATPVLLLPAPGGKRIGTLAPGARVRGVAAVAGDGCVLGWVQLAPRGYVCGDGLALSAEPPWVEEAPRAKGEGFAGYVFADHEASLPLGVVMATRAFVPILETKWAPLPTKPGQAPAKPQAEAYRVGATQWLPARQVRVLEFAPLPQGYRDDARWIDIDLDAQTLVAYQGMVPVFATLVSTGSEATPTPPGVYRVWKKSFAAPDATWAQIFVPETGVALRAAATGDRLGTKASTGSVLVAPADAAWLFAWSEPAMPPGWTMAAGVIESPGTLIQLRSRQHPRPALRGYAMTVHARELGY